MAGQLAAVMLLEPDDSGAAEDFPFWDVHEYDLARMYNFQCWIYGADPQGNAFIVDEGLVTEDRAESWTRTCGRSDRRSAVSAARGAGYAGSAAAIPVDCEPEEHAS